MATNKLGTLVYDLVADTKEFQQGLVKAGKPLTALKKLFIESRTPIEHFGIQLQGMQQMIRDGAGPLNMFSRSIADLAMKTQGGGRVAREFSQSLREQASAIIATTGQYHALSQADKDRVGRLQAAANAIEREVNLQRNSAAEKLKNKRALEQETAAAKQADAEQKKLTQEREKQIAVEKRQADLRAAHEQKILSIRAKARAQAKAQGAAESNRIEARNLAAVRAEIEKSITPRQRLVELMSATRAAYHASQITHNQFLTVQARVIKQLREINPEYIKERNNLAAINAQLKERAERENQINNILNQRRRAAKTKAKGEAESFEAERTGRVRSMLEQTITPAQRLARTMGDIREEFRLGNINQKEFNTLQKHVRNEYVKAKNALIPYGEVVEKTRGRLERFGEGMALQVAALARQISAISAAYFAIAQVRRGLSDALELGRSIKEFEIFTGSLQTSHALIAGLRDLAAETPLTMGASTQTVRTLLQYGVAQDQVLDITRRIGDVSGGSTERIQRLALAMGQVTANGRLQGQELRQLVESGFNPLSFIAKETGQDMLELRIRMAEGKVSTDDIYDALRAATSEGGRFADQLNRIGEETAFGQIMRLQGAVEKLRTEAFMPATVVLGHYASKTLTIIEDTRKFGRAIADMRKSASGVIRQFARDFELIAKFAGLQGMAGSLFSKLLIGIVDIEEAAKEMEEAMIEASENENVAISEVDKSIEKRIATLRREREELELGKDEFIIADAVRQGASEKYIQKLKRELELTRKVREEDEKRNEVARKAKKIISERDENEKWWKDWMRDRRGQPQMLETAQQFADSIKTPFDKLVEQLRELRGVAHILDKATMKAAERKLRDEFIEQEMRKERLGPTAAATRGSVEEFRLLQQMSGQGQEAADRRHKEQMLNQELTNRNLATANTTLTNLPQQIANSLEAFVATAVA